MKAVWKVMATIRDRKVIIWLAIAFLGLLTAVTLADNPFDVGNMYTDSAVYNYVGRVILRGGMPYKDCFDHKGPALYLINAFGQCISSKYGVWFLNLVFLTLTLGFAYKISKLYGCSKFISLTIIVFTMLGMIYYMHGGNTPEEYACCLIMISLYFFF